MISYLKVAENACSAPDPAVTTEPCAARNAYACGYRRMRAYPDIMGNPNQVIEFYAIRDQGVIQGTTIYGGTGADFDVATDADASQLRNFQPASIFIREAEAVTADHHAGVEHHTLADFHSVRDDYICMEKAVSADMAVSSYKTSAG